MVFKTQRSNECASSICNFWLRIDVRNNEESNSQLHGGGSPGATPGFIGQLLLTRALLRRRIAASPWPGLRAKTLRLFGGACRSSPGARSSAGDAHCAGPCYDSRRPTLRRRGGTAARPTRSEAAGVGWPAAEADNFDLGAEIEIKIFLESVPIRRAAYSARRRARALHRGTVKTESSLERQERERERMRERSFERGKEP